MNPDSLGLWELAASLDRQIRRAADAAHTAPLLGIDTRSFSNVVVAGMGGSGIGGAVAAMLNDRGGRVPLAVVRDHELPAWADEHTLVIGVSFSGNSAETLDVVRAAHQRGAGVAVATAGGRLAELADGWGAPCVLLDASIPMPRAAVAEVSIPVAVLLERLGLLNDVSAQVAAAADHLSNRLPSLGAEQGPAAKVARRIGRTLPLIYGAGGLGAVAAYRFKCQVNENVKAPAFMHVSPELNHNEIAGWGQHGDVTRQILTAVHLRHAFEPPRVEASFDFVREVQEEVVADVVEVKAEGDSPLTQLFDLVAFGDFVSLFMAAREGLDPGPVPALDELKRRLG